MSRSASWTFSNEVDLQDSRSNRSTCRDCGGIHTSGNPPLPAPAALNLEVSVRARKIITDDTQSAGRRCACESDEISNRRLAKECGASIDVGRDRPRFLGDNRILL